MCLVWLRAKVTSRVTFKHNNMCVKNQRVITTESISSSHIHFLSKDLRDILFMVN